MEELLRENLDFPLPFRICFSSGPLHLVPGNLLCLSPVLRVANSISISGDGRLKLAAGMMEAFR